MCLVSKKNSFQKSCLVAKLSSFENTTHFQLRFPLHFVLHSAENASFSKNHISPDTFDFWLNFYNGLPGNYFPKNQNLLVKHAPVDIHLIVSYPHFADFVGFVWNHKRHGHLRPTCFLWVLMYAITMQKSSLETQPLSQRK